MPSVNIRVYGPSVGEHTHDTLFGPNGNRLQLGDVALSPDLLRLYPLGSYITVNGISYRVSDVSYVSSGVPNVNTVEVWNGNPNMVRNGVISGSSSSPPWENMPNSAPPSDVSPGLGSNSEPPSDTPPGLNTGGITLPPELSPFSYTPSGSVTLPSLSEPNNNLSLGGDTSQPFSMSDLGNGSNNSYQPSVDYQHPNDNWTSLPEMYLDSGIPETDFNSSGTPSLLNPNTSFNSSDIPYADFSPSFQMEGTDFSHYDQPVSMSPGDADLSNFGGNLSIGNNLPSYGDYETTPVSTSPSDLPDWADASRTNEPIPTWSDVPPEWVSNASSPSWENNATSIEPWMSNAASGVEPWESNAASNTIDLSHFAPDLPNWSDSLRTPLASFDYGGFGYGGHDASVNNANYLSFASAAALGLSPGPLVSSGDPWASMAGFSSFNINPAASRFLLR